MASKLKRAKMTDSNIARKAALGTLITLILRLLSFACTQYTFRKFATNPAVLGQTSIQLELLHATVVFVSREGFRLALTKKDSSWNVAWLTVPVSFVVSLVAMAWHGYVATQQSDDFFRAGMLYCVAACLEGWAEPAILCSLRQMNLTVKASAEGMASVGKTVATVLLLQALPSSWSVTSFGLSQIVYSILYLLVAYWQVRKDFVGPRWARLDGQTCYMTLVFTLQGLFKHVLTEGDRIVLTTISSSYDQGVYAMGSAYGGLAARILLQPIEENCRLLWSRQSSASPTKNAFDALETSYVVLVKLVLYIGFLFSFVAVNYTHVLLNLLAGRQWGDNPEAAAVLSAFCVYTAFLAWNGTTEAFVYGVASTGGEMGRLGVAHSIVGLVFAVVAPIAVSRYGTVGLVAANCLGMFCRSLYSIHFAVKFFSSRQSKPVHVLTVLGRMLPSWLVMAHFVLCFLTTRWSLLKFLKRVEVDQLKSGSSEWLRFVLLDHLSVGVTMTVGLLTSAYAWADREFVAQVKRIWRGHND